jgi:CTP-dependent riboflavin kinase
MAIRLSNKQRILLEDIQASETHEHNGKKVPLYIEHITDEVQYSFNSKAERRRWLENMEERGLILIDKGYFLRLADKGAEALAAGPAATRRDFLAEEAERQRREEEEA